jgi:hypothetical protein
LFVSLLVVLGLIGRGLNCKDVLTAVMLARVLVAGWEIRVQTLIQALNLYNIWANVKDDNSGFIDRFYPAFCLQLLQLEMNAATVSVVSRFPGPYYSHPGQPRWNNFSRIPLAEAVYTRQAFASLKPLPREQAIINRIARLLKFVVFCHVRRKHEERGSLSKLKQREI